MIDRSSLTSRSASVSSGKWEPHCLDLTAWHLELPGITRRRACPVAPLPSSVPAPALSLHASCMSTDPDSDPEARGRPCADHFLSRFQFLRLMKLGELWKGQRRASSHFRSASCFRLLGGRGTMQALSWAEGPQAPYLSKGSPPLCFPQELRAREDWTTAAIYNRRSSSLGLAQIRPSLGKRWLGRGK